MIKGVMLEVVMTIIKNNANQDTIVDGKVDVYVIYLSRNHGIWKCLFSYLVTCEC